jgi:hydroxyacylglutathione hydrolase
MIVRRLFEPQLAHNSYVIGCGASGEAIVIDPHRDAEVYTRAAEQERLTIKYVTETHIHADYLSGTRELAAKTGAAMLLSDEGGHDWKYAFAGEARPIRRGDRVEIGNVRLDVLHTPGHTPEHLTFLITDGAVANAPIAAATGDFIFVGDVGRPDLLEKAVNIRGTMELGARTLYRSLRAFDRYEEWLQIWPGHGAGSSCGKGISAVPHSTLGYERRFNWAFKAASEDAFVAGVLEGQPDPPKYFATMKRMNKEVPRLLGEIVPPPRRSDEQLQSVVGPGAIVIDARPAAEFARRFLPGTLNIPLTASFVTWAGWLVPYDADVYLLLGDGADTQLHDAVRALALIGLDRIKGYFGESALSAVDRNATSLIPQVSVEEADRALRAGGVTVLDVRSDVEWQEGHLPGARHIPLGYLRERLGELTKPTRLVTQCLSGNRSAIAASILRGAGFDDVSNLTGGFDAWKDAGFAVVHG